MGWAAREDRGSGQTTSSPRGDETRLSCVAFRCATHSPVPLPPSPDSLSIAQVPHRAEGSEIYPWESGLGRHLLPGRLGEPQVPRGGGEGGEGDDHRVRPAHPEAPQGPHHHRRGLQGAWMVVGRSSFICISRHTPSDDRAEEGPNRERRLKGVGKRDGLCARARQLARGATWHESENVRRGRPPRENAVCSAARRSPRRRVIRDGGTRGLFVRQSWLGYLCQIRAVCLFRNSTPVHPLASPREPV